MKNVMPRHGFSLCERGGGGARGPPVGGAAERGRGVSGGTLLHAGVPGAPGEPGLGVRLAPGGEGLDPRHAPADPQGPEHGREGEARPVSFKEVLCVLTCIDLVHVALDSNQFAHYLMRFHIEK